MILADENIHTYIIRTLRQHGLNVMSVQEIAPGINDQQVIELAKRYDYLLLTEDKDFGEWVFAHHEANISILFLRYPSSEYKEITTALLQLFKDHELKRPFFATITSQKLRIRQL